MTLIELIVSMALFTVVLTLTVGFFITIQHLQSQYRQISNMQDEGRFAAETFSNITREAKTIVVSGTDTSLGTTPPVDLCSRGDVLTLGMMDSTTIRFDCQKESDNVYHLQMDSGSGNYYDLTTGQVNVTSLQISRGAQATYPKTLRYNMHIAENYLPNGESSPGIGEQMDFEDYLIMQNEL